MRRVFEGCIPVDSSNYLQGSHSSDEDEPIDDLDAPFTELPELRFVLDYPFEEPLECVARGPQGVTLRNVIDAVRDGFRTMYEGASIEDIPNLMNKQVTGDYGQAFHAIDDLVIELVDVDDERGVLEIGIGS